MNEDWAEQYRIKGDDWCDKESAASMLEETKSAVLSQRMSDLGDIPVSHAERTVKASEEWLKFIKTMVKAREMANRAKIELEFCRMKFHQEQSANATHRAEMRM